MGTKKNIWAVSFLVILIVSCGVKKEYSDPIQLKFLKQYPHPTNSVSYILNNDRTEMIISGENSREFMLTSEPNYDVSKYNTLQINIDTGNSIFREDELNPNEGNGKMLKVIGKGDKAFECKDPTLLSKDPEFVLKTEGIIKYKLNTNKLSKLGFVFINARLDSLKISVKFSVE